MLLEHTLGLMLHPDSEWENIRKEKKSVARVFLGHTPILAAIPCVASYYGVTQVGWHMSNGELIKMTESSALSLAVIAYIAFNIGVFVFGAFIDWMASTYSVDAVEHKGETLAVFVTAPIFIAGVIGVYPVMWVVMLALMLASCWSVYLIYEGIPILMQIPKEQGFMYASSALTIGLVLAVVMIITTVLIWAMGFNPEFVH